MSVDEIYELYRDLPAFVSIKNGPKLSARIARLRTRVIDRNERAARDANALAHDLPLFPRPTHNHRKEPRWQGSKAQSSLHVDIDAGLHRTMEPRDLYKTRPEYQQFLLKTFRDHIYQEVRTRKLGAFVKKQRDKSGMKVQQEVDNNSI